MGGWQQYFTVDASQRGVLQKVDTHVPLSAYLGPVGMPGVTAWWPQPHHRAQGRPDHRRQRGQRRGGQRGGSAL